MTAGILFFGRTVPKRQETKKQISSSAGQPVSTLSEISIDSIISLAKRQITDEQAARISMLENSISRGNIVDQKLKLYQQLADFWGDTMRFFLPFVWYRAEAARLENSEKSLTFAAHLILENLQHEEDSRIIRWEALQARDLFERSLMINPSNDSARVGLGACYLFGNISPGPLEGVKKILEVIDRDSTHSYALITLAKGSLISGQTEKAIERLMSINRHHPENLEAILMLADIYERKAENKLAADWYRKSLMYIARPDARTEIEKRILELTSKQSQ